jgi:hypothetical protein
VRSRRMQHERRALRSVADRRSALMKYFRNMQSAAVPPTRKTLSHGISLLVIALLVFGLGFTLDELRKFGLVPDHLYGPALTFVVALLIGALLGAIQSRGANRYTQWPRRRSARPCDGYRGLSSIIARSGPAEQAIGRMPRTKRASSACRAPALPSTLRESRAARYWIVAGPAACICVYLISWVLAQYGLIGRGDWVMVMVIAVPIALLTAVRLRPARSRK